jgi:broad specificity phosphatase PhoE
LKTKTLLFLRHGKTKYTGQFPDLTEEGRQEISESAKYIAGIVGQKKSVKIVSSPQPRALGTADIIATHLGLPHAVEEELAIRSMDFYDSEKANAIWTSFPNARAVDCAYANDPRFEEGTVVEKRSVIQHRFFGYLGSLFERFAADKLPDVMIHTSHYEVLWHLAATFGFKEPLIHGEVIKMELTENKIGDIHVRITFREYSRQFNCELPAVLFSRQFSI